MNKEEIEKITSNFDGGWWNYRLIEKTDEWKYDDKDYSEKTYDMHEVYYDKDGNPIAWSENPVSIYFSGYDDISYLISRLKKLKKSTVLKLVKSNNYEYLVDTNKTLKQITNGNMYGLSFTSTHFEEFDEPERK